MRIVSLPEHWRRRAMVVADVLDPQSWFTEDERRLIESFARPKRRREWMLSRIAERELRRGGATGSCVSFSHSGDYGAAAIDSRAVGIDVERLRDIPESSARHFLNPREIAVLHRCSIAHRLIHFWCAKEAAWKQRGGVVATLKRIPLELITEREQGLLFQEVETVTIDELVVALTTDNR
jgi:phosphopantetheinyl transferase (holo-ACP synthase)